ncbi:unnamed protein product, partial [Ectocarpus sp. 12 AP-2014]
MILFRVTLKVIYVVEPVTTILLLAASAFFGASLTKVQDLGHLSRDALHLGALLLIMSCLFAATAVVPMPPIAYKYCNVVLVICTFFPALWTINIKPVRAFLYHHDGNEQRTLRSWIFLGRVGGDRNKFRVACTAEPPSMENKTSGIGSKSHLHET